MPGKIVGRFKITKSTVKDDLFGICPVNITALRVGHPQLCVTWFPGQRSITYDKIGEYVVYQIAEDEVSVEFTSERITQQAAPIVTEPE